MWGIPFEGYEAALILSILRNDSVEQADHSGGDLSDFSDPHDQPSSSPSMGVPEIDRLKSEWRTHSPASYNYCQSGARNTARARLKMDWITIWFQYEKAIVDELLSFGLYTRASSSERFGYHEKSDAVTIEAPNDTKK